MKEILRSRMLGAALALAAAAAPAAASGGCMTDFRWHQKGGSHSLSEEQLESVEALADAGYAAAAWTLLGSWGDSYAALAAQVLQTPRGGKESFARRVVTAHWRQTAGEEALARDFLPVAVQHLRQYVEILRDGFLPDSDQILLSYLTAVRDHGLPDVTVFDAAWVASGYGAVASWQFLNGLGADRTVVASRVCYAISPLEARRVIRGDLLGAGPLPDGAPRPDEAFWEARLR